MCTHLLRHLAHEISCFLTEIYPASENNKPFYPRAYVILYLLIPCSLSIARLLSIYGYISQLTSHTHRYFPTAEAVEEEKKGCLRASVTVSLFEGSRFNPFSRKSVSLVTISMSSAPACDRGVNMKGNEKMSSRSVLHKVCLSRSWAHTSVSYELKKKNVPWRIAGRWPDLWWGSERRSSEEPSYLCGK